MKADYSSLITLFVLILLGFLLRKGKLLKDEHIQALPAVVLNIAYPALVFGSITSVDVRNLAGESLVVVFATLIITLALYGAGRVYSRLSENAARKPLVVFSMAIGNIVYVVLPIVNMLFGELGVYYAMLHATAQDVLIWTLYYQYFASDAGREKFSIRHLATPAFGALAASLAVSLAGWKLPPAVTGFVGVLGALAIPLALLYLGGVLAGFDRRKLWLPDRQTVLLSVFKVILLPIIVFGLLSAVHIHPSLRLQLSLFFAAPATIMSTVWARQFNYDSPFAIRILFFSTFLFFILIPVVITTGLLEKL